MLNDDHVKLNSITYVGCKARKGVSSHLHVKLQNGSCHRMSVCLVNDRGTPEDKSDDLFYEVEFDACIQRRLIRSGFLRITTLLEDLEEYNSGRSVLDDPGMLITIIQGRLASFIAPAATLEFEFGAIDSGDVEGIIVTLQIGDFIAMAKIDADAILPFFKLDQEQVGGPIAGEIALVQHPVEEFDDDEIEEVSDPEGELERDTR